MDVRGFDSYDISLGDEMRGERASLGKSLEDVERDLRIKVKMLTAIEDCDLTGFNNQSVIAGYVRSYAKYLGMNADDCYARFCAESGYRSPAALMSTQGDGSGFGSMSSDRPVVRTAPIRGGVQIAESRFAAPPSRNRFQARISFGAVTSALALIALIAGLSYGGWALLKDIQRIGFAPMHEAPQVAADPPTIATPIIMTGDTNKKPDASVYAGGGTLAAAADTPSDLTPGPRPRPRWPDFGNRPAPRQPVCAPVAIGTTAIRGCRHDTSRRCGPCAGQTGHHAGYCGDRTLDWRQQSAGHDPERLPANDGTRHLGTNDYRGDRNSDCNCRDGHCPAGSGRSLGRGQRSRRIGALYRHDESRSGNTAA